jgi:hypothetical protein
MEDESQWLKTLSGRNLRSCEVSGRRCYEAGIKIQCNGSLATPAADDSHESCARDNQEQLQAARGGWAHLNKHREVPSGRGLDRQRRRVRACVLDGSLLFSLLLCTTPRCSVALDSVSSMAPLHRAADASFTFNVYGTDFRSQYEYKSIFAVRVYFSVFLQVVAHYYFQVNFVPH